MHAAQEIHQGEALYRAGAPLAEARAAVILLHGRGATAHDILTLAAELDEPHVAFLAPQAAGNSWYPYSFLQPIERNEPELSSALHVVAGLVAAVEAAGIAAQHIVLGGFSQGACLAAEFVARHARRYGGLLVLSGGVIGPPDTPRTYAGSLDGMPVLVGCSDVDAHIPLSRVQETADVLRALSGDVTLQVYAGMGHIINQDEIERARALVQTAVRTAAD